MHIAVRNIDILLYSIDYYIIKLSSQNEPYSGKSIAFRLGLYYTDHRHKIYGGDTHGGKIHAGYVPTGLLRRGRQLCDSRDHGVFMYMLSSGSSRIFL